MQSLLLELEGRVDLVNFMPEEIHVLATRLATYVSSDSTTARVTHR
jgi:hypothetical protein